MGSLISLVILPKESLFCFLRMSFAAMLMALSALLTNHVSESSDSKWMFCNLSAIKSSRVCISGIRSKASARQIRAYPSEESKP